MNSRGFTLIELLVVISIIGMLSSIVLASLQSARQKAQISRTAQELRQYRIALSNYYYDYNTFPSSGEVIPGWVHCIGSGCSAGSQNVTLNNQISPYINGLPDINTSEVGSYGQDSRGLTYRCTVLSPSGSGCSVFSLIWYLSGTQTNCFIPGATFVPDSGNTICTKPSIASPDAL